MSSAPAAGAAATAVMAASALFLEEQADPSADEAHYLSSLSLIPLLFPIV